MDLSEAEVISKLEELEQEATKVSGITDKAIDLMLPFIIKWLLENLM